MRAEGLAWRRRSKAGVLDDGIAQPVEAAQQDIFGRVGHV